MDNILEVLVAGADFDTFEAACEADEHIEFISQTEDHD